MEKARRFGLNIDSMVPPPFPPSPLFMGPSPFLPSLLPFGKNIPFRRPHPHLHFFKKYTTYKKVFSGDGKRGFVDITKEYPSENGMMIEHIHKIIGKKEDDKKNDENVSVGDKKE